ncbi:MAG: hypothetical protein IJ389_03410 [Clostridia bacterium]|nr:hypothetical protein [Clostridia bacterium]
MKRSKTLSLQKKRILLALFTLTLLICSIGIFLMPCAMEQRGVARWLSVLSGAMVWLGGISCIVTELYISHKRRRDRSFCAEFGRAPRYGAIRFFRNKAAAVADVVTAAALVGGIIFFVISNIRLFFAFLALFVFSFGMHAMLNGINFIYINHSLRSKRKS